MTLEETIQQLQKAPVSDRIQIIEQLLQSLKAEIAPHVEPKPDVYPIFRVQTFSLGEDVLVDRDELYAGRGF